MRKQKPQAGFTLLELLVVIAIIGLLAGIILISLQSARGKARDAKRAADIRQIMSALEQYHIANGTYPTGTLSIQSSGPGDLISDPLALDGVSDSFTPNYIGLLPQAPTPTDGNCGSSVGPGNNNYWYSVADDGSNYNLTFCLGKDTGGLPGGTHTATSGGIQ